MVSHVPGRGLESYINNHNVEERLLCERHLATLFLCIISLSPHNNSELCTIIHSLSTSEAQRGVRTFLKLHSWEVVESGFESLFLISVSCDQ